MNTDDIRRTIDDLRGAMPTDPLVKVSIHDERDMAALTEFLDRRKAGTHDGGVGNLLGIPILHDESTPSGVLRTCHESGHVDDIPIR